MYDPRFGQMINYTVGHKKEPTYYGRPM